ncbi:MAG: murein L,D-transpeptidase catalytic domain-containing protein [Chitinophagaceae bacterium]
MKILRLFVFSTIAIIVLSWFNQTDTWEKTKPIHFPNKVTIYKGSPEWSHKLKDKASEAKTFVKRKGYNDKYCFLIDMSLPSGQNRFFIYNLEKDSLVNKQLVAHGNCYEYWLVGRKYSNVVGSGCTSLGKYRIGNSYIGKFGYSYKLHGLDSTNNNAFERTVVLHSHSCVPDNEVADDICQSNGCPTVSPKFLLEIKKIVNSSKQPVLLWIYE